MTVVRLPGPTRNGGAYALAYYHDDRGESAPEATATGVIVTEYSRDGRVLAETVLTLKTT